MPFKPEYGICVNCGEEKLLVVKAGYCNYCNETVRKNKTHRLPKQTPIKKGNKNAKANNDFYKKMWDKWKRQGCLRSAESGKDLGSYSPAKVAHILSRGAFPGLAYVEENVVPLLPEEHHQLDHGDCTKMKIWPWIQEKRQELKRKYYGT